MFKEKLDALVREHRLRQKIASIVTYTEARIVWNHIEELFQEIVERNLELTPNCNRHILELCCLNTDIMYSDDNHYMQYLSTNNKNCSEILNAVFEIAYHEGILVIKKDSPNTRYLRCFVPEKLPIEVEIYEFIYQSPSEK